MPRREGPVVVRPTEPAVRGTYMRMFAAHVDRLPRPLRSSVNGAVPNDVWQSIHGSGTFTWLPIGMNRVCTQAIGEWLTPDEMHHFFRTLLLDTARSPLLHGLVESVLRIAVQDPGLYLVWVAKGYQLLFRNAGTWVVSDRSPGHARLELRDAPEACTADPIWLDSLRGGLSSLFDLKNLEGTITIGDKRVDGSVVYEIRWQER